MNITFQNPGLIDMQAVITLGVSVKPGENPIGYFGTGLKFAIATLLRGGHTITIWRGTEAYHFTTEAAEIRGQSFSIVHMNGQPLGFTTEFGKNWEMWQAFRELYANCLDEGGEVHEGAREPNAASTTILVHGTAFTEAYHQRHLTFLSGVPAYRTADLEIHNRPSAFLYYRGIRVAKLEYASKLTYNILSPLKLTEDRNVAGTYVAESVIARNLLECTDTDLVRRAIDPRSPGLEDTLYYSSYIEASPEFIEAATSYKNNAHLTSGIREILKKWAPASANYDIVELSREETLLLEEARAILIDLDCRPQNLTFVETLGRNIHGLCTRDGEIYISRPAFSRGAGWLASTIYEEWIHATHGLSDESRAMQQFLFDKIFQIVMEHRR